MTSDDRLRLLRRILMVKAGLTVLVWGLPALLAPTSLVRFLGLPEPGDSTYLRCFGALALALALAYWYASKDPVRNAAIVKAGVVDNGLVTVVIVVLVAFYNLSSVYMWVSAVLTLGFCLSFLLLMPREEPAALHG